MFACKLWTSTKIVRGMNWVEIATAGCRTTGTSRSGIASDMLVVEGLVATYHDIMLVLAAFYINRKIQTRKLQTILPAKKPSLLRLTVLVHDWLRVKFRVDQMDSDFFVLCILSLFIHVCHGAEYAYTVEVVDGGDLNINFMMLFGNKILLQETKKVEGSHKFSMKESGDYQLCFDNSFSYQTRKVLFFELFLLDENGSFDETNMLEEFGPVREEYSGLGFEMQKFQKASNNIKNLLNKVEYHQSLLRAYEARDRAIMNANLERVTLWSVVNSVILVVVGLLQVIAGGDITFSITSPKGLSLINDLKHTDGTHKIDLNMTSTGYGDYLFCFDNAFSIQSDKRVFFELFLLDAQGHFLGGFDQQINVGTEVLRTLDTRINHFQNVTTNVKNNLNTIERLQRQYASIELADRTAIERSYEMINFWSVLHLVIMLFAFFVQVYMVRSLFEENSMIGLILRKGRLND
ncbi:unnamed protein product [Acanthocheilonema viteae]|uniref:GOLD domain-containing protein n=1 Tax=Acanthocheilonema viteae TaxID=6277 RepID=A0A498S6J0_ACAVI|nr:unnamed protein product [Acanthocheilonema viteae]